MTDDERLLETGRLAELGLQASSLVHELRQPVFAIKALAQIVADGAGEETQAHLTVLLAQVETLEQLVNRYSDSSRRPTGERHPTDLGDAVRLGAHTIGNARPNVTVDIITAPGTNWIHADPIAVRQITSNLVRNAVYAARSRVEVVAEANTLRVQDDGEGIRPDILERLGEPFVTSKPPGEGTGLGLAVTQSLISSVDGVLHWETSDAGTCFTVTFTPYPGVKDE